MDQRSDQRRLFIGAQVEAAWPENLPSGRFLSYEMRHLTLVFLGNYSISSIKEHLPFLPMPTFEIGPAGIADQIVFLPQHKPRVAATHASISDKSLITYQQTLEAWFRSHGHQLDKRPFYPHITLARTPFDQQAWSHAFHPFPFYLKGLHLYESMGNLTYASLWHQPWLPPFEELDHTADIAFLVRGKTVQDLHFHAQLALSFHCPALIPYFSKELEGTLDRMIASLNVMIGQMDREEGSPFKAVSYHGSIRPHVVENVLTWEMIVDV